MTDRIPLTLVNGRIKQYPAGDHMATAAFKGALAALNVLTPAADKLPYYTSGSTAALADFTTVGRAFAGLANPGATAFPRINADNSVTALSASDARTALGLGTMATEAAADYVTVATTQNISGAKSFTEGVALGGAFTPLGLIDARSSAPALVVSYDATRYAFMQWVDAESRGRIGTDGAFNFSIQAHGATKITATATGAEVTGALSVTGVISGTAIGGALSLSGATTASRRIDFATTGGSANVGLEASTGGSIIAGSAANALALNTGNTAPIQFGVNSVLKGEFTTAGLNVTGALSCTGTLTSIGSATVGDRSTMVQINLLGLDSGTNGGASLNVANGANTIIAIGNQSNITGGAYSGTPMIYANTTLQTYVVDRVVTETSTAGLAVTGALSCTGNATLGDSTADTHTVNGILETRPAADGLMLRMLETSSGSGRRIQFSNAGTVNTIESSTAIGSTSLALAVDGVNRVVLDLTGAAVTGSLSAYSTSANQGNFNGWSTLAGVNPFNGQIMIGALPYGLRISADPNFHGGCELVNMFDAANSFVRIGVRGSGTTVYPASFDSTGINVNGAANISGTVTAYRLDTIGTGGNVYGVWNTTVATSAYVQLMSTGSVYGYIGNGSSLVSGGSGGQLSFRAEAGDMLFSYGTAERMRMTTAGALGIGVTAPVHILQTPYTPSVSLGRMIYNCAYYHASDSPAYITFYTKIPFISQAIPVQFRVNGFGYAGQSAEFWVHTYVYLDQFYDNSSTGITHYISSLGKRSPTRVRLGTWNDAGTLRVALEISNESIYWGSYTIDCYRHIENDPNLYAGWTAVNGSFDTLGGFTNVTQLNQRGQLLQAPSGQLIAKGSDGNVNVALWGDASNAPALGFYTAGGGSLMGYLQVVNASAGYLLATQNIPFIFGTNNAEKMRLHSGTESDLTVGTASSFYTAGGRVCIQANGSASSIFVLTRGNTDPMYLYNDPAQGELYVGGNKPLLFYTNNAERMRITAGGNLLLGTTTDTGQKLQVNGDLKCGGLLANGDCTLGNSASNAHSLVGSLDLTSATVASLGKITGLGAFVLVTSSTSEVDVGDFTTILTLTQSGGSTVYGLGSTSLDDGRILYLYNESTTTSLTLSHEAGTATAGTRFSCPSAVNATILPRGIATCVYAGSRWRVLV